MIIYLGIAILMALIGYNAFDPNLQPKFKSWNFVIVWGILVLFWGTSYINAPDIPGYISYFERKTYNWLETGYKLPSITFEKGFNILSCIIKSVTDHYYVYQFILFTSELFLIMKGLEKIIDKNNTIIVVCALFFILPLNLLGALRQGIAIALFIYAIQYIERRKFIKYILLLGLASCFHNSAIFLVLLYWLPLIRPLLFNKRILFIGFLLLNVCYIAGFSISKILDNFLLSFFDLYENTAVYIRYIGISDDVRSNFGLFKILEMDFVYVCFLLLNKSDSRSISLLKILFLIYFILNMLLGGILAHRIGYYFIIIYNTCLIYSLCMLGQMLWNRKELGYLLSCTYFIILNLFYFQNSFSGQVIYKNMFLEHLFKGVY